MTKVPFAPFGVSALPDGRWDLVGANAPRSSVAVLASSAGGDLHLVRQIRLPQAALGTHLTADGRYLLVADGGGGADVVAVSKAVRGEKDALLGVLNAAGGVGAIEVTTSPGDRFAFVSLEYSRAIAVFNLSRALSRGFTRADFVGLIPVGLAPVGMAVSPNGRWLYATVSVHVHGSGVWGG
jgi:DNA-binding beta-propeller fold protein YncE